MATTAYGNVINLQPGGPGVAATSNRILMGCRDLASRRLREVSRTMLEQAIEALHKRADALNGKGNFRLMLDLANALREKGSRLEAQLSAHWAQEFDGALKGVEEPAPKKLSLDDLQIVDVGEMDEELALKSLARRLEDKCADELYALGRRINFLIDHDSPADAPNPLSPDVFTRSLLGALRDVEFEIQSRIELYRCLEGLVVAQVGPVFHAINAQLLKHDILPNLKRGYGRSPSQNSSKETSKEEASGDIFNMLQRLVSGGVAAPSGAAALPGVPGIPGAGVGGGQSVPVAQVWASLEAMQHAVQNFAVGQPVATENTNVLHNFRASEVGQGLGQLDAITVDIVAMLFDMIFDDREIADPIKALVGKLQIPILKVAMLDRAFFSSKAHPTRRLLDLISRTALRWGKDVGHDDPIYLKIAEIVDQIHGNFQQDTDLFTKLSDDFEQFLAEYEATTAGDLSRAASLVAQREREELAGLAVERELRPLLSMPQPGVVAALLEREWRLLLKQIYLAEGLDSEAWQGAMETAAALVDSTRAKRDPQERQALACQLPVLLKQLIAGFDRIKTDGERRHRVLDELFSVHAKALRGTEMSAAEPVAEMLEEQEAVVAEPEVTTQVLGDGEVTVESLTLSQELPDVEAAQEVEDLQRGDWVEFIQPDGEAIRYRLSWVSPQRGIFLFTNPHSPQALAVSPEAMSVQLQRGEVRILSTEPIFDRALARTIEVLQAA